MKNNSFCIFLVFGYKGKKKYQILSKFTIFFNFYSKYLSKLNYLSTKSNLYMKLILAFCLFYN